MLCPQCSSTDPRLPARRSTSAASARASLQTLKTKPPLSNRSLSPTRWHCSFSFGFFCIFLLPQPVTPITRLQVSSLRAEREAQRRSETRFGAHLPPAFSILLCAIFSHLQNFASASKLAATWRSYAGRRSLCLNLEQRRRKHLEGFIAMPSPATLSSCVLSLNATHSCCVPLYVPQTTSLPFSDHQTSILQHSKLTSVAGTRSLDAVLSSLAYRQ